MPVLAWLGALSGVGLGTIGLQRAGRRARRRRQREAVAACVDQLTDDPQDLVLLLDGESRVLKANAQARLQLAPESGSLEGAPVQGLLGAHLVHRPVVERLERSPLGAGGLFLRREDGSMSPVQLIARELPLPGETLVVLLLRDLTGEHLPGAALGEATANAQALEAQLRQDRKLEGLGQMAGGLAHDLNNVLGAILGLAAGHKDRLAPSEPLAAALETIISACRRGRGMTGGLLRFVRREAEPSGPVELNVLVREMVQLLSHSTLKEAKVSLRLEENLPTVRGDAAALSHALLNLCVNAVDAMPPGGRLTILTMVDARGRVCLSVRDQGAGMSPEVKARALEPFFTTKPSGKGTGLGLSQVATTMKAHQGLLELDSHPGEGTAVTLAFPPSPQPVCVPTPVASRPLSILVVDDDAALLEALCPLLESMGHQVQSATGGREALRRFQQGGEFDLVLLDLTMPGLGGAETMLRLLELRPRQAILLATGHGEASVAPLLAGHPTVGSIQKPFGLEELERRFAALGQVSRIAV